MRTAALAPLLLGIVLAGCSSGSDDPGLPPIAGSPAPRPGAPPAGPAEIGAPAWVAGQWWQWEVSGGQFDPFEVTTVVASVEAGAYRIGTTERDPGLRAQPLHVPPIGVVAVDTLAWEAHDLPMRLIEFPLYDGKTWTGEVEGGSVEFVATFERRGEEDVVVVEGRWPGGDGPGPRFVYSPALAQFLEFALHYESETPFSAMRLVDHGLDHAGMAHVMTTNDKFLGGSGSGTNAAPPARFAVSGEKTFLVIGCYLGGDPGVYAITFITPNGEEPVQCRAERTTDGVTTQVLHRASIEGEWTAVFAVGGQGFVEAEVLGVLWQPCALGGTSADAPPCAD